MMMYFVCQGSNLEFHHLKKFNMTMNYISSYRITLVGYDPATTLLINFQVGVSEQAYGRLNLMVFVARPQADRPPSNEVVRPLGKDRTKFHFFLFKPIKVLYKISLAYYLMLQRCHQ